MFYDEDTKMVYLAVKVCNQVVFFICYLLPLSHRMKQQSLSMNYQDRHCLQVLPNTLWSTGLPMADPEMY